MTNNPTIDGVSREDIKLSAEALEGIGAFSALHKRLRALLDAPVVERKPDAWIVTDMNGDSYFAYDKQTPSDKALYTVAPEVAALQSTIAQLQARIVELESGRGDPVAWANGEQLKLCVASPREVQPNNPMMHNLPRNIAGSALKTDYCNTPLFTAPPAPVSVVHPFAEKAIRKLQRVQECAEDGQDTDIGRHWLDLLTQLGRLNRLQRSPARWEITQQGEDCLDATAALNGVRK